MNLEFKGSKEAVNEDMDDMMVAAGNNLGALLSLKKMFEEMIEIAKPFSDEKGNIRAPNHRLPFEKISLPVKKAVANLDGAFIDSMAMTEFMKVFEDGLKTVIRKIQKVQASAGFGKELR